MTNCTEIALSYIARYTKCSIYSYSYQTSPKSIPSCPFRPLLQLLLPRERKNVSVTTLIGTLTGSRTFPFHPLPLGLVTSRASQVDERCFGVESLFETLAHLDPICFLKIASRSLFRLLLYISVLDVPSTMGD